MTDNIKASTGFEILLPKAVQAIPVPCGEWDILHSRIEALTTEPWLFHTIGSMLIGASLATFISILTGAVSTQSAPNAVLIAWAVVVCTGLVGAICLLFADKERRAYRQRATDVATQMSFIEQRYERTEV